MLIGFPGGSDGKESARNSGAIGSVPESGRSPGGDGNALLCSCLEKPMDRGAWHGCRESDMTERLNIADVSTLLTR